MPGIQTIDFGPDPLTESMGKFASGFSDAFFKQQTQKKNEDIFQRIKEGYGPDAKPDRIFKDILESEGLDQDYKRDLLKEVKEYSTLAGKSDLNPYQKEMVELRKEELNLKKQKAEGETPITPFQQKNLKIQQERLQLERQRLKQAAEKNHKDLPELISKYSNEVLKNAEEKLPAADKALLNRRIQANMKEDDMDIDAALEEALDYINVKNQIVEESVIEKRPTSLYGQPNPEKIQQSMESAYQQLSQLYDAGIESQRDLRNIAKRSGWQADEVNRLLQAVYSSNGRKLKSGKPKTELKNEAQVAGANQDTASEAGGLDDILFGE